MNELLKLLQETQDKWGRETVEAILKKIDDYPIYDVGTLRRSISYNQDAAGSITFNMADYGEFVDAGVNGLLQSQGSRFSFRGRWQGTAFYLKDWASRKNLNPYAVAFKIQRDGIKPKPFFSSVISSRVPQLGEAVLAAQQDYINRQINNLNKD